jgi:PHD/YefM family antitoxin component YafN of YafNO toxin-antitoxin module
MKEQILNFLIEKTNAENVDVVNTKTIAQKFNITTKEAYKILSGLEAEKKAVNHGAANEDNLNGTWWSKPYEV